MNIFLSQSTVADSVKDLDDLRLQKQLVECYQLLTLAIKEQQEGHEVKAGHYHHPVYLFYKDNIPFLAYYGYICCCEFYFLVTCVPSGVCVIVQMAFRCACRFVEKYVCII